MRWWFQPRAANKRRAEDPEEIALQKRKAELDDLRLSVKERELKIDAIRRVVEGEPDPVTALEVVAVATHRGKLPPAVYQRRQRDQSPLEAIAMSMLQKRLDEDPTEALERIIDRRERLEEAADRLSGGGRSRYDDGETGNPVVDVARAVANSPLGEAVGAVLGHAAQQHLAATAATAGATSSTVVPTAGGAHAIQARVDAPSGGAGQGEPPQPVPAPAPAAGAISGPRPVSFRVGVALRVLKGMQPPAAARWIIGQADQHEQLGGLLDAFLAAEPDQVPGLLGAFIAEAEATTDQAVLEWVPLVRYLLEALDWTLQVHRELRALAIEDDGGGDDGAPRAAAWPRGEPDLGGAATG